MGYVRLEAVPAPGVIMVRDTDGTMMTPIPSVGAGGFEPPTSRTRTVITV